MHNTSSLRVVALNNSYHPKQSAAATSGKRPKHFLNFEFLSRTTPETASSFSTFCTYSRRNVTSAGNHSPPPPYAQSGLFFPSYHIFDASTPFTMESSLQRDRHIRYFLQCLKYLPTPYTSLDSSRLTVVHFIVQSLSLLGALDQSNEDTYGIHKDQLIDWIYSLQVKIPNDTENWNLAGFQGSTCMGNSSIFSHLAMTYSALCSLRTLGDDFSRLNNPNEIVRAIKSLQLENGSFSCLYNGSESDMRFVYCACAVSYMLDNWSGVDVDKTIFYIRSCRTWDGAIGLSPGLEGHGGSVFCAVASLYLMGKIDEVFGEGNWKDDLIHWCLSRQLRGMQGRPNKNEDTCYSYWIGGALRLLNADNMLNKDMLTHFVLNCQTQMGGFSKLQGGLYPDVLHSFYSLAWLSLAAEDNQVCPFELQKFDCALGMARRKHNES